MSKAKDISEIISDANFGGTLDVVGKITADAGVDIDNINIDGTTIALSSGDLTLDVAGDIILDANGADIKLADNGTVFGELTNSSSYLRIKNPIQDQDIEFVGNDGGSDITALRLDMSDAGTAVFNNSVGIQVVPEAWQSTRSALQVGDSTAVWGDVFKNSWFTSNVYRNSSNNEVYINASYAQQLYMDNGGNIVFKVAPSGSADATIGWTTAITVDNSGKVGIGTTSAGLGIMAVHGATGGNATFKAANTSSSGNTTCIMAFMDGSGSATSNSAFLQGFNGVTSYYLLGNGTHTFTSDENVKKNIETTRDGYLEDLAKLRVVKYNWKHEEDGTNKELGLIAQEVEEVFPNLVMEDIDPQIEEGQRRNKMIKVTVLPFMLLKAIQELSAKNDAQQTLIEAMEARITALEGRM